MADLRIYRESTRYVYATITSATDPSAGDVWMAVVRQGVPAATSDLRQAEWVPGETWTNGERRARLLIGPESVTGQLAGGPYRVYLKTDLGAEVPFEPEPYRLVITTETGAVDVDPVELAAVAFTGSYDDLLDVPAVGGPYLPAAGGTLTGPLVLAGAPTIALHAATKAYVDALTGRTPVALVDQATITTDAGTGVLFRVTLGGNRVLANPTNPVDGQRITWEITQDATGNRTLALGNKFAFGSDITSLTLSTAAGATDVIGAQYNAADDAWRVLAVAKGF